MDSPAITVQVTLICIILKLLATETDSSPSSIPGCLSTRCGNLTIPFPFVTSAHCVLDDSFLITCNESYNPPKPFLGSSEVLDISIDGLMKVRSSIASDCYNHSGSQINGRVFEQNSYRFQFPISSTRNKLTAIGCDTYAFLEGWSEGSKQTSSGCVSLCHSFDSVVDGTCSGIGCCQASILPGVKDFLVDIRSFRNLSKVRSFNPCGYAFVVEADAFEFSSLDLLNMNRTTVPVVLDWSIGNVTCQVAQRNLSSYVCQALHSECLDAIHGRGYRCNCVKGFQGNPYLPDGCQDIDECKTSNPCIGTCQNLVGNYSCSCPEGFEGDGEKNGYGCHRKSHHPKKEIEGSTFFYIASGLVIPGVGGFWIFRRRKLKKLAKLRRNTFESNGGLILEYMLSTKPTAMFRVFTAEEIKRATDNYAESRILSSSCVFGTVYRGELDDAGESKLVTVTIYHMREEEIKVFIRKLVSFLQIQHKNVSKLIGCCLETQVPLFVNEFVSINTLSDYIIDDDLASSLSWDTRLRIAAETAGALAYLHSEAGLPIIHGNLSSLTISLHNGSTVKIHDVAFTNYCDSSEVLYWMGASGHLDPEYLYSGLWTVKSDVYSFGVVLAELLTGKRSINFFRVNEYFVSSFEGDALLTILDNRLAIEGKIEQLTQVSKLAKKCLSDSSVERPTMKEVEVALASIISGRSPNSRAVSQKSTHQVPIARRLLRRNKSL